MYCKTCGNEINDNAVICPKCGCPTNQSPTTSSNAQVGESKKNARRYNGFVFRANRIANRCMHLSV